MDFFKSKQPIALPVDSEDETLLRDAKEFDPELAVDVPQQERGKRCCFTKGTRGKRSIRLVGHLLILGAFLYWFWRPSARFYHIGYKSHDIEFPDFTDLDTIPSTVPKDFVWVCLPLSRN